MADNKTKTGRADRDKVNAMEAYEVEYLHQQYPKLSHQQVRGAVRAAGPERKNIISYLEKKGKL
jgi:hypothetical protein